MDIRLFIWTWHWKDNDVMWVTCGVAVFMLALGIVFMMAGRGQSRSNWFSLGRQRLLLQAVRWCRPQEKLEKAYPVLAVAVGELGGEVALPAGRQTALVVAHQADGRSLLEQVDRAGERVKSS
jgi:uncharacterized membrane protein YphA (DoxX/SURF4 family)